MYNNLIIDGNNLLYKAYYAQKTHELTKNHIKVSVIHKFLHILKKLVKDFEPDEIFITWDKRLNPDAVNFRRELASSYKENRVESAERTEIHSFFDILNEICGSLGMKIIMPYSLEADDVVSWLTTKLKNKSLIVSNDRDLLQLVDKNVDQKLSQVIVTVENFDKLVSCSRKNYVLYKAILGDVSDNIRGLHRFGEKRACDLANKIGDTPIKDYQYLSDEQKEIVTNNLEIVDIKKGIIYRPEDVFWFEKQYSEQKDKKMDFQKFLELIEKYDYHHGVSTKGEWRKLFDKEYEPSLDDFMDNLVV